MAIMRFETNLVPKSRVGVLPVKLRKHASKRVVLASCTLSDLFHAGFALGLIIQLDEDMESALLERRRCLALDSAWLELKCIINGFKEKANLLASSRCGFRSSLRLASKFSFSH